MEMYSDYDAFMKRVEPLLKASLPSGTVEYRGTIKTELFGQRGNEYIIFVFKADGSVMTVNNVYSYTEIADSLVIRLEVIQPIGHADWPDRFEFLLAKDGTVKFEYPTAYRSGIPYSIYDGFMRMLEHFEHLIHVTETQKESK